MPFCMRKLVHFSAQVDLLRYSFSDPNGLLLGKAFTFSILIHTNTQMLSLFVLRYLEPAL